MNTTILRDMINMVLFIIISVVITLGYNNIQELQAQNKELTQKVIILEESRRTSDANIKQIVDNNELMINLIVSIQERSFRNDENISVLSQSNEGIVRILKSLTLSYN